MSAQIQSTQLRKFVTLHKTSAQGGYILGKQLNIWRSIKDCFDQREQTRKHEKVINCWGIGKYGAVCKNISTFVKHNFENPIKMSHHIRFSPRQHFAWNGWTLNGSATTKGGCCHTKLNVGLFYRRSKSVWSLVQQSACDQFT